MVEEPDALELAVVVAVALGEYELPGSEAPPMGPPQHTKLPGHGWHSTGSVPLLL